MRELCRRTVAFEIRKVVARVIDAPFFKNPAITLLWPFGFCADAEVAQVVNAVTARIRVREAPNRRPYLIIRDLFKVG